MRKFLVFLSIGFLAACGTQGTVNSGLLTKPVAANQSRLFITRNTSMMYFAGAADVALDGKPLASLARGASVVQDVPPGNHFLTVKAPMTVGDFTTSFATRPGKTYEFVVGPNEGKSLIPGALFGQVGDMVDNSGHFQVVPTKISE